jgi:hypothetical protein
VLDGLGPVGGGAHADDEHVEIASMPLRAALVAGLVDEFEETVAPELAALDRSLPNDAREKFRGHR